MLFRSTKEEYDIAPYSYNRPLASTELKNIPMDILLSLNGFDELNVVDKGYQSVHRKVIAIGNCKVIMAWLLKSKNFMTYSKFSNNTFIEDYIRIDDKTLDEAEKDYEKIMNFYHYGFNVKEM